MDDLAVGAAMRRVRLRRNERQIDVARRAGISRSTCSAMERGHIVSLPSLRAAAAALDMRVEMVVRWRGGDLDRMLHARHAAMTEQIARLLTEFEWEVHPEVSFNHFGERGVIDLVGWHAVARAVLIVELKTELVDVGELLGTMDRRRRLIAGIARERGWTAERFGAWVVVAESRTNRRHVGQHRQILRAAFPEGGHAVRPWLKAPTRNQAALWFLTNDSPGSTGRGAAPVKRVSRARSSVDRRGQP